ncbi:MAG: FAD:protein FMN transferase [Bacteroidales bacterium]|nr:FAD:protein FMN transferase [Bacteroidales bacterium]
MKKELLIAILLLGALFAATTLFYGKGSCGGSKAPVRLAGKAQGSYYSIIYYDKNQRDFKQSIDSLLDDFDLTASLWVDSSEICRVNRATEPIEVSPRFADLFQKSMQIHDLTDGCFDCRIGPLVSAYGFARKQQQDLSDSDRDSLLQLCHGKVWLDTSNSGIITLHKQYPQSALDFNAIAQGYSVDLVCDFLVSKGVKRYLVDIGGEVRTSGKKPDGQEWNVGIERPAADKRDERTVEIAVPITDQSIVTSGSYRKYYEKDGLRYSHTIDPYSGTPVQHSTLSASVVDSTAWRADALATAFMVMGLERGIEWMKQHPEITEVFLIYDNGDGLQHYSTPQFKERIKNSEK